MPSDLQVHRYSDAGAFLEAAEPFLMRREVENALLLGIAHAVRANPAGLPMTPYFATVNADREPCTAAFQTLPGKLGITRGDRLDALELLAADILDACQDIETMHGPEPAVRHFAEALGRLTDRPVGLAMAQRIYDLEQVSPPQRPPAGRLREATERDLELVSNWVAGFLSDIGERGDPIAIARERMAARQLFLWDDGGPRSMAGWAGKTPNGVRVNYVYTPPEQRGRGYASAAVAELSSRLLSQGNRFCCLFTDLANPTSNGIYQAIGYRPVADMAMYRLGGKES